MWMSGISPSIRAARHRLVHDMLPPPLPLGLAVRMSSHQHPRGSLRGRRAVACRWLPHAGWLVFHRRCGLKDHTAEPPMACARFALPAGMAQQAQTRWVCPHGPGVDWCSNGRLSGFAGLRVIARIGLKGGMWQHPLRRGGSHATLAGGPPVDQTVFRIPHADLK